MTAEFVANNWRFNVLRAHAKGPYPSGIARMSFSAAWVIGAVC
jgi:hypothetical protein